MFFSRFCLFSLLLSLCAPALQASGGRPARPAPPTDTGTGTHIPVRTFARTHGFQRIQETDKQLILSGQIHRLTVEKGGRRVYLNGVTLWLNQPVIVVNGHWSFSAVDVENTLAPIIQPGPGLRGRGARIIVIDPGHGGRDSGAVSATAIQEKAVALDIANRMRRQLVAQGHTVYLTRHADQYLDLEERARRAKTWNADVFVSVHANSSTNTDATGIETFILSIPGETSTNHTNATPSQLTHEGNRHNAANMLLGYELQKTMLAATNAEDRGVRRARFTVLRDAPAPAALVEVGFLSNPAEAARLGTAAHRERLARALSLGIENYFTEVRRAELLASP